MEDKSSYYECDSCGRLTDLEKLEDGLCPRCRSKIDEDLER